MSTITSFSRTNPKRLLSACVAFLLLLAAASLDAAELGPRKDDSSDPHFAARRAMMERDLKGRGITDARVLAAMDAVPRHLFVPEQQRAAAYEDRPLPIGEGQTISQPYMVAVMAQLLELNGTERILEIGTGSGYHAAVLARLAAQVYSVEILGSLSARAKRVIDQLGIINVELKIGDGFFGWDEKAPFDAILMTAAAPRVPEPLWRQLREGGRLVMPLGAARQTQKLVRIRKVADKQIVEAISEVIFVPLTGAIQKAPR
jgi:protein-L-isoaspartate(D-aspartate) O-methyltransferase